MDKKIGIFLSLLLLYFIYLQREYIQQFFLTQYNSVKASYLDGVFFVTQEVEEHFNQANTIARQNEIIADLTKQNLRLKAYQHRFATLVQKPLLKDVTFTNAISYVNLSNRNRLWLDPFEGFDPSKVYGAVDGEYSSGIVIAKDGQPMILLNSDPKCVYGVYIGKEKAPGVIYGIDARTMEVRYIPSWMEIEKGERVQTSGLDNVFSAGIDVGVVQSVEKKHGYKVARVKPFADNLRPEFFYILQ